MVRAFTVYVRPLLEYIALRCGGFATIYCVYKILFNVVDVNTTDFFTLASTEHDTRDRSLKLLVHHNRIDNRKHFFFERIVPVWNNLTAILTLILDVYVLLRII